jgi:hypothetical protein
MPKKLCFSALSLFVGCYAVAQSIVVNPDGTHSIMVHTGNVSALVNSNGSHSTVINRGSTAIIVNPDGTHSTAFNQGSISLIVGPTGMHSTVFNNDCAVEQLSNLSSDELDPIFVLKHEKRIGKRNEEIRKVEKRRPERQ